MIVRLLNHFKILEQIGRGGMGEVFDTHSGGWSPDGKAVVYTKDTDDFDIYIIENYR